MMDDSGFLRRVIWMALAAGLLMVGAVYGLNIAKDLALAKMQLAATLDDLGPAPAFQLTAGTGKPFSSDAMVGKIWVADFFFTTCAGVCPKLAVGMKAVQTAFAEEPRVALASISVDPATDTPQLLTAYGAKWGAVSGKWTFLTGDPEEIHELAREGFKLGSSEVPGRILHSDRFVLVDIKGRIRGYYHGDDDADVQRLIADIRRLLSK